MSAANILNTPGYFYAVAYALSTLVTVVMQKAVKKDWRIWLFFAANALFLLGFMRLTREASSWRFVLAMALIIAVLYLNILCAVRDAAKAGFYCVKTFIYGEFSASLCWQIYYNLALRYEALRAWPGRIGLMCAVYGGLTALFYLMELHLRREDVELHLSRRDLLVALLTSSSAFVVSNLGYIDPDGMFSGSFARDIFAIRTLVDLSGVALIYALHSQLLQVQLRLEKDALHSIMENQYRAYQISRESIELVNEKYHDLKHQIALLKSQAASEKSEAYLGQMEREIQNYEVQNQTGNMVLDAILSGKSAYCRRRGIELKFIADGKLLNFMDDMEVSALFGNMLDNAIESVERIPEREKRLIRLYIGGEKQFLRIRMENYCQEQLRFVDGMPVTHKRDKRYHGFGMKSMQKTVAKYGGSMLASQSGNWFELKILIPLEQGATAAP